MRSIFQSLLAFATLGMIQVGCDKADKPDTSAPPKGVTPTDVTLLVPGMN